MTTIIWDGTHLISDSQVTQGETKDTIQKIHKVKTPYGIRLVAFAGAIGHAPEVLALVSQGADPTQLVGEDAQVLVISKEAAVLVNNKESWKQAPPVVIGSGTMAAKAVLALGYSAEVAVKVACQVDLYSSTPIKKLKL